MVAESPGMANGLIAGKENGIATGKENGIVNSLPAILPDQVKRVLLVRLRSIGDTVLLTPCLSALKAWQPNIEIDVLVEPLSAPILSAHPLVSHLWVMANPAGQFARLRARMQMLHTLRARDYDLAFNLHGGTTATFITRLARATTTVGYAANRYSNLLKIQAPKPELIWQKQRIHCVEQQLGLLKWCGISVPEVPALSLSVAPSVRDQLDERLKSLGIGPRYVVIHPSAAFASKQWEAARFAQIIEYLQQRYALPVVIAVAPHEKAVAAAVQSQLKQSFRPVITLSDLNLAELMALISKATLFIGNDSGPAHIAAAFQIPLAVIFGSSNSTIWHPWTKTPYRLLRADLPCIPCPGYTCSEYPAPECIKRIGVDMVMTALDELMISC